MINFLNIFANDYNDLWKELDDALDRDHPKTAMSILEKIADKAQSQKDYGELLAAQIYHARIESEVTPDSLTNAINRLKVQAVEAEGIDATLAAVYNTVLGRICDLAKLPEDSSEKVLTSSEYYDLALRNPDILAATKISAYKRMVSQNYDDRIFNNDLLSLIGHEAERYQFLRDYYMNHGNRTAACIEQLNLVNQYAFTDDDLGITNKRKMLNESMEMFADCPESALFAYEYYKTLKDDSDVSEQTVYQYLVDAVAKYDVIAKKTNNDAYCNVLRNALTTLISSRFSLDVDKEIVLSGIKNVKDLKIEFMQIKATGKDHFYLYNEDTYKKACSLATGFVHTINVSYDRPVWQTHKDTLKMPELPYGVYIVKAFNDKISCHAMLYHTGITLLTIGTEKRTKSRVIVVSKDTGAPIANANVELIKNNWRKDPTIKRLTTDANGELNVTETDTYDEIWVSTKKDVAFQKRSFGTYFQYSKDIHSRNIVTLFTDRTIYRPGQTIKGSIIVHNSKDTDSIHVVPNYTTKVALYNAESKNIASVNVTTDNMGNGAFEFAIPTDGKNGSYTIYCENASSSVRIEEYKRPTFEVNVVDADKYDDVIEYDEKGETPTIDVVFKANTYSQIPVQDAEVTYSIHRESDMWAWWRYYYDDPTEQRTIASAVTTTTDANGKVTVPLTLSLPEKSRMRYAFIINVKVTDKSGESHEKTLRIMACHSSKNKKIEKENSDKTKPEFELSAKAFSANGDKLTFTMRNAKPAKTYAYYMIMAEGKILESSRVEFVSEYKRQFTYKPEYGNALYLTYAWVMDGKLHTFTETVLRPQPDLKLPVKWTTFRDRTQPGSMETWSLKVGKENEKTLATLTATIYDKSLDALVPANWWINVIQNSFSYSAYWSHLMNEGASTHGSENVKRLDERNRFYFATLREEMLPYYSFYPRYVGGGTRMLRKGRILESGAAPMVMSEMAVVEKSVALNSKEKSYNSVASDSVSAAPKEKEVDLSAFVRTNLNETAYFNHSLHSDEDGNICLSFQMPETMTTWRLLGLVHDEKMRYSMLDTTCVAKKDIIVKPNAPRFLRQSDRSIFAATVSNTTQKAMQADVVMQLLIPETNAIVWQKTEKVNIDAEGTTAVEFASPAIDCDSLLVFRIAATATDGSSDGEQHYIPVLPATQLVTTSRAFTQHRPGSYIKDISDLFFDDSTERTLTVKYVPQAVQMIVDAIPSVTHPERKDAMSIASAVYVSSLFHSGDTLNTKLIKELGDLQLSNGSWPWWQGMRGSVCTSVVVARLLARLEMQGASSEKTTKMLTNVLPYIKNVITDEAKDLRKLQKEYPKRKFHPSEICTDVLYIFALGKNSNNAKAISILSKNKKDVDYLLGLMEKASPEMTIYGKAHSAALLSYYGRKKKALEHLESMKQYSVCTEEAGRYYDSPNAYYSWRNYRIPSEVAAIEAMRIVEPQDTTTVEEMKRWLLHEKRTQQWDNSINTADAVYAFLLGESYQPTDSLNDDGKYSILLDDKEIMSDSLITVTDAKTLKVDKQSEGTSWGAVFVSQRAPLTSLKTMGSGFKVRREIITDKPFLSVGDRVTIRITIDADRDYDYVEVTDNRAACLEPVNQMSGYSSAIAAGTARGSYSGYYRVTHDNNTEYFFDQLAKGTHIIETDYYVDRSGIYRQGSCTVTCTYAPEYRAIYAPEDVTVK